MVVRHVYWLPAARPRYAYCCLTGSRSSGTGTINLNKHHHSPVRLNRMIRTLIAAVLVFTVLFQTGSALACGALVEMQAGSLGSHSCCADVSSQAPEKPSGMPDDACCFERGSLLAKAAIPEAPQLKPHPVMALLTPAFSEILAPCAQSQPVQLRPLLRPPPSQPHLQVFRI